jgi:hypothetical protein
LGEVTSGVESSVPWFKGSFWDPNGPIIANWLVFDSLHPEVSDYVTFLSYFNIYIYIYIHLYIFLPFQNFAWVFVGLLIVSVLLIAILVLCGLFLSSFREKCPWFQKSIVPSVDPDAEVEAVFSKNEDSFNSPLPLVGPLEPTPDLCLSWFRRIFSAKKTVVSGPPHASSEDFGSYRSMSKSPIPLVGYSNPFSLPIIHHYEEVDNAICGPHLTNGPMDFVPIWIASGCNSGTIRRPYARYGSYCFASGNFSYFILFYYYFVGLFQKSPDDILLSPQGFLSVIGFSFLE